MVWFKVDDGFYTSRKVLSIPRTSRLAAVGLWTMAGNWSGRELTDGKVPGYVLAELGATPRLRRALVEARLWLDHGPDGIEFNKWSEYQPTRARVEDDREKERIRKEKYRMSRRDTPGTPADVPPGSPQESPGASEIPDPTRPDPTNSSIPNGIEPTSEVATATPRPDVEQLLDLLDEGIAANGSRVPSRSKANRDAMRLLLDKDGRTAEQVATAIRWCQADEFWRANILSASKLREKYDQLRLAASRSPQRPAPQSKAARNAAEYQRIFGGDHEHAGSVPALDARIGA